MDNYQFCAEWVRRHAPAGAKVLDYGCGRGQIVTLMRRDVDAYGCDVFVKGGNYESQIPESMREHIKPLTAEGRIPFDNETFDIVISNQVIEHVENLEIVLSEIRRVLKPGGQVLSLFPHKGVWREGHCGVPFIHWLPRNARVPYAFAFRVLGVGYHKSHRSLREWAPYWADWIDRWTHYRPYPEIREAFSRYLGPLQHHESEWLDARLGRHVPAPGLVKRAFVRRMAGLVFSCEKTAH